MSEPDLRLQAMAATGPRVLTRTEVFREGVSIKSMRTRLADGRLENPFAGVYAVGGTPLEWVEHLRAACLAGGDGVVASHRSAALLYDLWGVAGSIIEVTGPIARHARPPGVVAHRSKRLHPDLVTVYRDVPATTVGWTLCVLGACVPPLTVEKAAECAMQRGWVTEKGLLHLLSTHGGRG